MSDAEALHVEDSKSAESTMTENKIICGLGDEVKHMGAYDTGLEIEPELHYVGAVVGAFMLFLILYVLGDYLWTRYVSFSPSTFSKTI